MSRRCSDVVNEKLTAAISSLDVADLMSIRLVTIDFEGSVWSTNAKRDQISWFVGSVFVYSRRSQDQLLLEEIDGRLPIALIAHIPIPVGHLFSIKGSG